MSAVLMDPELPPLEPSTYYKFTVTCITEGCESQGGTYHPTGDSNVDSDPRIVCGNCGQRMLITDYEKLDPQPIRE